MTAHHERNTWSNERQCLGKQCSASKMAETDMLAEVTSPPSSVPDLSDLRCTESIAGKDSPELAAPIGEVSHVRTIVDINQPVQAFTDWTLIRDDRVIRNLLQLENQFLPSTPDYFRYVQKETTPSMRKIVADWMLQVCQEVGSQPEVFCLAVNYMDRFLSRCPVMKNHLQLVGSVCLLISSKFKETCSIPGEKLIFYTDYSITRQEIQVRLF